MEVCLRACVLIGSESRPKRAISLSGAQCPQVGSPCFPGLPCVCRGPILAHWISQPPTSADFTWMWPIGATSGRLDGRRKWEVRVLAPFSVLDSNSSSSYTSSVNRPAMVSASGQGPVTPPFPLSFQSRVVVASFRSYPLGCLTVFSLTLSLSIACVTYPWFWNPSDWKLR